MKKKTYEDYLLNGLAILYINKHIDLDNINDKLSIFLGENTNKTYYTRDVDRALNYLYEKFPNINEIFFKFIQDNPKFFTIKDIYLASPKQGLILSEVLKSNIHDENFLKLFFKFSKKYKQEGVAADFLLKNIPIIMNMVPENQQSDLFDNFLENMNFEIFFYLNTKYLFSIDYPRIILKHINKYSPINGMQIFSEKILSKSKIQDIISFYAKVNHFKEKYPDITSKTENISNYIDNFFNNISPISKEQVFNKYKTYSFAIDKKQFYEHYSSIIKPSSLKSLISYDFLGHNPISINFKFNNEEFSINPTLNKSQLYIHCSSVEHLSFDEEKQKQIQNIILIFLDNYIKQCIKTKIFNYDYGIISYIAISSINNAIVLNREKNLTEQINNLNHLSENNLSTKSKRKI